MSQGANKLQTPFWPIQFIVGTQYQSTNKQLRESNKQLRESNKQLQALKPVSMKQKHSSNLSIICTQSEIDDSDLACGKSDL